MQNGWFLDGQRGDALASHMYDLEVWKDKKEQVSELDLPIERCRAVLSVKD
jgi:hypothetical protein